MLKILWNWSYYDSWIEDFIIILCYLKIMINHGHEFCVWSIGMIYELQALSFMILFLQNLHMWKL
jgi:hypothetical protein